MVLALTAIISGPCLRLTAVLLLISLRLLGVASTCLSRQLMARLLRRLLRTPLIVSNWLFRSELRPLAPVKQLFVIICGHRRTSILLVLLVLRNTELSRRKFVMQEMLNETGRGEAASASTQPLSFFKLDGVSTHTDVPFEISIEYIKANMKRGLPRFHHMPEFQKVKGWDHPILLVGGGPSLRKPENLEKLRKYAKRHTVIACGSVHNWLVSQGIIPTYTTVCDPDAVMAEYLTSNVQDTQYLIATNCHPAVLDTLKDNKVFLWHCYGDDSILEHEATEEKGEFRAVGGGCTVGLRSISIAILLGYSNIHFFGFDSCLDGNFHHAYDFATETEELGKVFEIKIGSFEAGEKIYYCAGYQLAQVVQFKEFFIEWGQFFFPTFHGEGLLKDTFQECVEQACFQQHIRNVVEAKPVILTHGDTNGHVCPAY